MTTEVKYAATFSSDSEDFVDEHLGLEVKRSWLSKDDASTFLGLFAAKSFEEGDVVCIYTGKVYRTTAAQALEDKSYLMRIGEQCYIDARTCDDEEELEGESRIQVLKQGNARKRLCIARYINDSINPAGYNVEFQKFPMPCPYPPRLPYTDSASPSSDLSCPFPYALVRARRRIECGEELFVNYGRWYWASAGLEQPNPGAPGSPGMRTQTVKLSVPYRIPFLELHALRTKAVEAATRGVNGLAAVTAEP